RRRVVGRRPVVVLELHLPHAGLGLGPLPGRLGHALTVGRVFGEEGDLDLVRLQVESRREVFGDELDVVPAEAGGVDLGTVDVLETALVEARIDAGGLPVDDVVARRHLARRAAQARGERPGDDLDAFPGDQPVRFAGRRGRIGRVGDGEHELLAHGAAPIVGQIWYGLADLHSEVA